MVAMVSAMAAQVADSDFGRGCVKFGELLDDVIPVALAVTLTVSLVLVAFDFVH